MGAQKMARETRRGHRQPPQTRRFESIWGGAVRTPCTGVPHIGSAEKSTCLAESVDEEVHCATAFTEHL